MNDVISLDSRRPPTGTDPLVCTCGCHWWDLRIDAERLGALTLAVDGTVTGYAGTPYCRECGRDADLEWQ